MNNASPHEGPRGHRYRDDVVIGQEHDVMTQTLVTAINPRARRCRAGEIEKQKDR